MIGVMTVAVSAGSEHLTDDENIPWKITAGSEALEQELAVAARHSVEMARERAYNSRARTGVYQGADRLKVMSVKLSDHCGHE